MDYIQKAVEGFVEQTGIENARREIMASFYDKKSEDNKDDAKVASEFKVKADSLRSNIAFDTEFTAFAQTFVQKV
jgi:hypothetical protein